MYHLAKSYLAYLSALDRVPEPGALTVASFMRHYCLYLDEKRTLFHIPLALDGMVRD